MIYKTECKVIEETLEWENYIPSKANKLIIGTFPTVEHRRSYKFFYPNKDNPFWKILSIIAETKLIPADQNKAVSNRQEILSKLNLGITDMGYKILRHANSSLDQSIFPIEFMNIFKILDDYPTIEKLIFTSSSGENSVEGWFRNYCKLNSVKFPKMKGKNPKRAEINIGNRIVQIVTVHSTSKAAARSENELIDMYKKEILDL